jgi:hypothetical protein
MFIASRNDTPPAPFEGAERFWSIESLLEFRSFERSWFWTYAWAYKHRTPNGVKTVEFESFNESIGA